MNAPTPDVALTPDERASWDELIRGPRPGLRRRLRRVFEMSLVVLAGLLSAAFMLGLLGWVAFEVCVFLLTHWPW